MCALGGVFCCVYKVWQSSKNVGQNRLGRGVSQHG